MSTLASVVVRDVIANLPAAGIPGRLFFSTDTHTIQRDNGSSWDTITVATSGSAPAALTKVALTPSVGGNFTKAHGLSAIPQAVVIQMTSSGGIWLQSPTGFDATNLYLTASDGPITGTAVCF